MAPIHEIFRDAVLVLLIEDDPSSTCGNSFVVISGECPRQAGRNHLGLYEAVEVERMVVLSVVESVDLFKAEWLPAVALLLQESDDPAGGDLCFHVVEGIPHML